MKLGGQVNVSTPPETGRRERRDRGYAMAVLLVAMSIAAVMMTVVMPVWKQMAQREKEEELVFRGQQYVHALRLFGRKYANASPPNLDVLVEQRFLRKKFKDPITNDDFQLLLAGQGVPGSPAAQPGAGRGGRGLSPGGSTPSPTTGRGAATGQTGPAAASPFGSGIGGSGIGGRSSTGSSIGGTGPGGASGRGFSPIGTPGAGGAGGIIGVASKSKDKSLRIYNGRNHYNEWAFVNTPQTQTPGVGGRGAPIPGQRGRQGQQPAGTSPFGTGIGGQRGTNPGQPIPSQPGPNPRGGPTPPFQPAQPILPGRGR